MYAGASPENRIAAYGNLVAPLSEILPPQQNQGRNDPLAFIGKGIGAKQSRKKMEKAQKDAAEGKSKKLTSIENGLKWVSLSNDMSMCLTLLTDILDHGQKSKS